MPIALDVHAHFAPAIPAEAQDVHVGAQQLFRPEALLGWMDEHAIERAWVSIPPPLYRPQLSAARSSDWARYVNDALAAVAGARLQPLYHLPLEHPDLAAQTAERYARAGAGFSAPAGGPNVACFSDARLGALWSELDRAGAFVFVHPGSCCDGRLGPYYLENLLGNPYETTVAISHLVFSGLRAHHRRIRFCFAHGGGAAAMLAGRWQRGYETQRPGIDVSLPSPKAVLATLLVDSIVHDAEALRLAARTFGSDGILFGSDWPFPMGLPSPEAQLAGTEPALHASICAAAALNRRLAPD